ncbi:MAG: nucleotidyltransferase domain-containing protein [Myxococcales bacterium]|nr:nucleotidyltransferase domain-containing protein [Myxococcales bacterium]
MSPASPPPSRPEAPPLDMLPEHWTIVRDILRRHVPHCTVWAFGSRATGTAKPYSDLDLAVLAAEPLPLDVSAALAEAFSESDLPWKVDVVEWVNTAEPFRSIIAREHVVVVDAS